MRRISARSIAAGYTGDVNPAYVLESEAREAVARALADAETRIREYADSLTGKRENAIAVTCATLVRVPV